MKLVAATNEFNRPCRGSICGTVDPRGILTVMVLFLFGIVHSPSTSAAEPFSEMHPWNTGEYRGFTLDGIDYTDGDYLAFARTGANLARYFFHPTAVGAPDNYRVRKEEKETLDQMISAGRTYGFRVVVTINPHPGGVNADFWNDLAARASLKQEVVELTHKYAGDQQIAGIDLINEPQPPGPIEVATATWHDYATELIDSVRTIDPQRIVIFQAVGATYFSGYRPLDYDGVVYSVHMYTPHVITHQGVGGPMVPAPYPSDEKHGIGTWNRTKLVEALQPVIKFKEQYKKPVYIGEFSCVNWSPGRTAINYVSDAIDIFEEHGFSWTYHAFRSWYGWDPELISGIRNTRSLGTDMMQLLVREFARNALSPTLPDDQPR